MIEAWKNLPKTNRSHRTLGPNDLAWMLFRFSPSGVNIFLLLQAKWTTDRQIEHSLLPAISLQCHCNKRRLFDPPTFYDWTPEIPHRNSDFGLTPIGSKFLMSLHPAARFAHLIGLCRSDRPNQTVVLTHSCDLTAFRATDISAPSTATGKHSR
jgi:hypothetical protein